MYGVHVLGHIRAVCSVFLDMSSGPLTGARDHAAAEKPQDVWRPVGEDKIKSFVEYRQLYSVPWALGQELDLRSLRHQKTLSDLGQRVIGTD